MLVRWEKKGISSSKVLLPGPVPGKGIYFLLGFQRGAGGRVQTILGEAFSKRWFFLIKKKNLYLLCLFLLFPPPQLQTPVKLNSCTHPTVLESNFSFFFNHSILKWGMKCSSQTWCVRSSFFCLSRQYRACFLLQGKCARTQWAGESSFWADGPWPGPASQPFQGVRI